MFKAVKVLQASIVMVLAGCASAPNVATSQAQSPDTAIHDNPASAGPASETITTLAYVAPRAAEAPAIQAGGSINQAKGFTDANGRLLPDIQAYANEVSQTRNVPLNHVTRLLQAAHYNPKVARLMTPSSGRIKRSWVTYRKRYVEPVRINQGVSFWQEHQALLDDTAKRYGVPVSVIVAIIGVETLYGRYTGSFAVLDALATLGFRNPDPNRPERSQLFRDQLADLIELDWKKELDAMNVTGSFAGAMGLPQFMPGSLRRFAADGDRDSRINLHHSVADAVASVARFLRLHGWEPGLPVFAPVTVPANAAKWVDGGLTPNLTWPELNKAGFQARAGHENDNWTRHPVGVIDLLDEPRNLAEYRVATPNFFALTEYNRSYFYATSVAELANILADRMGYGRAF
jgi:membrane-bound lytic murein transglycosylase B|tara:strand:+ start:2602 stop:3810 length:1209 start_codon:yes stop_codon:yes gene_type:complete